MERDKEKPDQPQSMSDIKLELFHYARNEQDILRVRVKELKEEVKGYKDEIKKQNWMIMLSLFALLGVSGFTTYTYLHNWLKKTTQDTLEEEVKLVKEQIKQRLDNEFQTPRISEIITEKAKEYTEKNARQFIEQIVDRSIKPILTKELNVLKERNRFTKLGDEAITGSGRAFDELIKFEKSKSLFERTVAEAEIERVKSAYLFMTRLTKTDDLIIKYPDGSLNKGEGISTPELISILKGENNQVVEDKEDWRNRAMAAKYLGYRFEKGVPEALVESSCVDQNLEVRKLAISSFRLIVDTMGDVELDVLECKYAKEWWRANHSEIEKRLK